MFKDYNFNENNIFPPNLGDFIPKDAPVRLISDIVDLLDLSEVRKSYSNARDGRPAYYPVMLL